jgi:Uma2 family endonuclease
MSIAIIGETGPPTVVPLPPPDLGEPLYEIIDGQRVEIPHMSTLAARIANRLMFLLELAGQQGDLGQAVTEVLFHLALPVDRNRRPDVAFITFERWPKDRPSGDENAWDVVPDLVVEVISPNDYAEELLGKIDEYFQSGVRVVWIVYPKQALVYVYESLTRVRGLTRADVLEGGVVLPSFRLPLDQLFPPAQPPRIP